MDHPDQDQHEGVDPVDSEDPKAANETEASTEADESDARREKFLSVIKARRSHDLGPHTQEAASDDVRRRRAGVPQKGKVRRRPRNV